MTISKYLNLSKKFFLKFLSCFDRKIAISAGIGIFIIFLNAIFWIPPVDFPVSSIFDLRSGQTLSVTSDNFLNQKIIKSGFWFKSFVFIFSLGKSTVEEGNYALYEKQNVITLAWRISHGLVDITPVRVTVPEGLNSFEISSLLSNAFPSFDKNKFTDLVQGQKLEGYLFPDTYFIMPGTTEDEIIKIMNDNYYQKIKEIEPDINKFGKSESDVIKMASIVEEEARTVESREIIAGILWKRISLKMPLQVDASFKYIDGKTTATLSTDDLKISSPYNSYTNRGLPPTPISNPGLDAIKATINPIKTAYLYFLTDRNGNMHYAKTFAEHVANKQKYL